MKKLFCFIRQLIFPKVYTNPTRDDIEAVDFDFHQTLKELELYDKGQLKNNDSATRSGGLREYCQKRKKA